LPARYRYTTHPPDGAAAAGGLVLRAAVVFLRKAVGLPQDCWPGIDVAFLYAAQGQAPRGVTTARADARGEDDAGRHAMGKESRDGSIAVSGYRRDCTAGPPTDRGPDRGLCPPDEISRAPA